MFVSYIADNRANVIHKDKSTPVVLSVNGNNHI